MKKLILLVFLVGLAALLHSQRLECRPAEAKAHELAVGITCSGR